MFQFRDCPCNECDNMREIKVTKNVDHRKTKEEIRAEYAANRIEAEKMELEEDDEEEFRKIKPASRSSSKVSRLSDSSDEEDQAMDVHGETSDSDEEDEIHSISSGTSGQGRGSAAGQDRGRRVIQRADGTTRTAKKHGSSPRKQFLCAAPECNQHGTRSNLLRHMRGQHPEIDRVNADLEELTPRMLQLLESQHQKKKGTTAKAPVKFTFPNKKKKSQEKGQGDIPESSSSQNKIAKPPLHKKAVDILIADLHCSTTEQSEDDVDTVKKDVISKICQAAIHADYGRSGQVNNYSGS